MHSVGLTTPVRPALAQLWAVLKEFHAGEFVQSIFKSHHLNQASVARAMRIKPQGISNMFNRTQIGDDTLVRLSEASGVDFLRLVQEEKARLSGADKYTATTAAAEPQAQYGSSRFMAPAKEAMRLTILLDEYDEAVQLQILRFIQQLPKKAR